MTGTHIGMFLLCLVGGLAALSVQAVFLLLAATLLKIENRSFLRALGTTVLGCIAALIFGLGMEIFSVCCFFFFGALIMVPFFNTTYLKAFGAMLIACVIGFVFGVAIFILFLKLVVGL